MPNIKHNQLGFTLVETTIALGILVMGIMASLTLMMATFNFSKKSEQEIIVVNLAREGIEIARTLRNNGTLFSASAGDFIVDVNTNFNLNAEVTSGDIDNCNATNACQLYLAGGRYLHDVGIPTSFKRMVTITDVSGDQKRIESKINWTHKGKTYNFVLETNLTNWLEAVKLFN